MKDLEDLPDEFEAYECSECGNIFFVEYMPVIQDLNRPGFCCYCGVEFQFLQMDRAI